MYKHILIPLDGSPEAEHALSYGIQLAGKYDSQITILRVASSRLLRLSGMTLSIPDGPVTYEAIRQQARYEAEAYIQLLEERDDVPEANYVVVDKLDIAEAILETAEEKKADLIIMFSHRRQGVSRWVLGSVAERVVRHSQIPVFLAQDKLPAFERILVPLDESESAERALSHAKALAQHFGSQIILASVLDSLSVAEISRLLGDQTVGNVEALVTNIRGETQYQRKFYLQQQQNDLQSDGCRVDMKILEGHDIGDSLLRMIDETHTDLLVMSTHGRTGVNRWLLGSVAESVVRETQVPALLVHIH